MKKASTIKDLELLISKWKVAGQLVIKDMFEMYKTSFNNNNYSNQNDNMKEFISKLGCDLKLFDYNSDYDDFD